jgi:peroxiredoxin Q/BCP
MALKSAGEAAPGFELRNQDNQLISLGQFKGKWVLTYFYPRASTPGCTVQACGLRDKSPDWKGMGVVILGISPDKPAALKKFISEENLNFQLLGDPDHHAAEAYGTWQEKSMYGKKYMGMARVTYIIDPQGKIAHVMPKVDPKTHADEVADWLKSHAVK